MKLEFGDGKFHYPTASTSFSTTSPVPCHVEKHHLLTPYRILLPAIEEFYAGKSPSGRLRKVAGFARFRLQGFFGELNGGLPLYYHQKLRQFGWEEASLADEGRKESTDSASLQKKKIYGPRHCQREEMLTLRNSTVKTCISRVCGAGNLLCYDGAMITNATCLFFLYLYYSRERWASYHLPIFRSWSPEVLLIGELSISPTVSKYISCTVPAEEVIMTIPPSRVRWYQVCSSIKSDSLYLHQAI